MPISIRPSAACTSCMRPDARSRLPMAMSPFDRVLDSVEFLGTCVNRQGFAVPDSFSNSGRLIVEMSRNLFRSFVV